MPRVGLALGLMNKTDKDPTKRELRQRNRRDISFLYSLRTV